MSLHKLTAGSGYDYLTRQVAALDATHKGHVGLAAYYTARGESPGRWMGAGMAGIDGLTAGDVVTAEQMQALFGLGLHPLAAEQQAAVVDDQLAVQNVEADRRLGAPFKVYANDISPFRVAVAQRLEAVNRADGLPADWPVPAEVRARVRTEVATRVLPGRARPEPGRCSRVGRDHRPAVAAEDGCGRRLRPDLLPGQERVDAVGDRRPEGVGGHRRGASRGRRRRPPLH